MQAPAELTVPTCVGCGAMGMLGTCEAGCSEVKLVLVRAAARDAVVARRAAVGPRLAALRGLVQEVAESAPEDGAFEPAYRALQTAARATLARWREDQLVQLDLDQVAEPATVWWCPQCDGIDAPQDCLGICVWRQVAWVRQDVYEREHAAALAERDAERRLVRLARLLAFSTPRSGQWESGLRALQEHARSALAQT